METENNQESVVDLEEIESSVDDIQDNSESEQKTEVKQPKLWQVVRSIQKSVEELKTKTNVVIEPKSDQKEVASEEQDLTSKDVFALFEAKVPSQDIDEVVKASKLLGKSITETLQDGLVKARLKDLAEQRQTAQATNTQTSRRGQAKLTDEEINERARQGKEVDMEALAQARINLKRKK